MIAAPVTVVEVGCTLRRARLQCNRKRPQEVYMKRRAWALLFGLVGVLSISITVRSQQPAGTDLSWAFHAINGSLPAEEGGPKTVPGSARTYTKEQIDDLSNPPDWFP